MDSSKDSLLSKAVLALVTGLIAGALVLWLAPAGKVIKEVTSGNTGSPSGTTFSTAKIAAININPQSVTSSSTSLFNGDASDRMVLDTYVSCSGLTNMFGGTGAGLATYDWYMGTSSVAAPTGTIAGNTFLAARISVATSSPGIGFTATSTYTSSPTRLWRAGEYMVIQTTGTSSAAVCNAGLHYIGL